jgi:peptide/nickel transport system substrate-binding protein
MVDRATKLKWRRKFRRGQKHVETATVQAEQGLEDYFFKRFNRLHSVKRFIFGWVTLLVVLSIGVVIQTQALSPYYQTLQPTAGGILTEGVLGTFTTANPLYAVGPVDASVSRLVFAALLKQNGQNQLINDMAFEVQSDERNVQHTVVLREDIYWHDGKKVTADDVVFTYKLIQNPDAKSPLRANWVNVGIEKIDDRSVRFTLPHPLASFPHLLTNGVLPQHILGSVPPSQLRTADFNTTSPIGSGPFKWDSIQISGQTPETREEQIGLSAFEGYHDGKPDLSRVIIKAIHTPERLRSQFNDRQVDTMVGLEKITDEIRAANTISEYEIPVNGQVMIFLKTSNDVLKDKVVRQAITKATNRDEILRGLGYAAISANGPLLKSHLGYQADLKQLAYNLTEANALLDQNGWVKNEKGIRQKDGLPLVFQLYSRNNSEYAFITQTLQRQWREAGIEIEVVLQEDTDLQSTLALHSYDALLYGITVGPDPDVYAYWHSSQADVRASNRLNFSEFKSKTADIALESGRTRADAGLRAAKYRPFIQAWQDESPAIALYQPRFLYVSRGKIYGLNVKVVNSAPDRYANVQHWRVRTERVTIE